MMVRSLPLSAEVSFDEAVATLLFMRAFLTGFLTGFLPFPLPLLVLVGTGSESVDLAESSSSESVEVFFSLKSSSKTATSD